MQSGLGQPVDEPVPIKTSFGRFLFSSHAQMLLRDVVKYANASAEAVYAVGTKLRNAVFILV